MSHKQIMFATAGILVGLFMASMEVTVVATAMPTIVGQLGGLAIYSWVFSAYMLASTTTIPIFGKLSDLYGRRPVYIFVIGLFLIGSLLSGLAQSMPQLVAFRAVQGLGAGGLIPLAFIMIGDMYTAAQRARMQGLLAGVWGVSSVVGPLLGGFLVDQISWRWVFYINVVPGLLAAGVLWSVWHDEPRERNETKVAVDYAGATLLTAGVVTLLLGLFELGSATSWILLILAAIFLTALIWVERHAADPIVPLSLFRERLFMVACLQSLLAGWALFGTLAFVPLFVQSVLGTSATAAGAALTPMILGWVSASIIGTRWLLPHFQYRTLILAGMGSLTVGTLMLSRVGPDTGRLSLTIDLALMGIGMGLSVPTFLIAVQASVQQRFMGTATSALQFGRTIGGAFGVSVMGVILALGLTAGLAAAGLDSTTISIDSLLNPLASDSTNAAIGETLRNVLTIAMQNVFFIAFISAALALIASAFTPKGGLAQLTTVSKTAQTVEAEGESQPATGGVGGR